MNEKSCSKCKQIKSLNEFGVHPSGKYGRQPRCLPCTRMDKRASYERTREEKREERKARAAAYYQANKSKWAESEKRRKEEDTELFLKKSREAGARYRSDPTNAKKVRLRYLLSRYGITLDDYSRMFDEQHGLCAICQKQSTDRLHVDHCHSTGRVRGLLCFKCNSMIGKANDNLDILRSAIAYLIKADNLIA